MLIWFSSWAQAFKRLKSKTKIPLMFLFVLTIGSVSFYLFERGKGQVESIFDAVYWLLVTVTTVGYGDIFPKTTGGRITFALVALAGIGTIAYIIEEFVSISTRGELKRLFGIGEVNMKSHTVIVGWNTASEKAIKEMVSESQNFIVVGSDLNHTELESMGIKHISGDATRSETLNRCKIKDAKTMIISLTNDSQTIMIALAARKLNPNLKIVAMCEVQEHTDMMIEAGIDHVVSHAEISGRLLAHSVLEPIVAKFIMDAATSAEGFDLKQIKADKKSKLSQISIGKNERVIAIYRNNRFEFDSTADAVLEENDYIIVIRDAKR